MTESSDQETSRIIRQDGSSGGDISPADSSDLAAINENLTERIRLAETPKEIREYLKLRDELQDRALRQIELETVKIKVEEAKNQITFSRNKGSNRKLILYDKQLPNRPLNPLN